MAEQQSSAGRSNFRRFFFRGLGIVLPTILTIWILIVAYQFVDQRIATPINRGIQESLLSYTSYPAVTQNEVTDFRTNMSPEITARWKDKGNPQDWLVKQARRAELEKRWNSIAIGRFVFLDLIGLFVAAILIYSIGLLVGSFVGRRLYQRGEELLQRLPLFNQVYPHVKQVTDLLVGGGGEDGKKQIRFNRVVAVQYPRKGIWSMGLVTGDTMRRIQDQVGEPCITVFIPNSPTPFTGFVITVPVKDSIELPLTIDEALRFTITGGVVVPPGQIVPPDESGEAISSQHEAASTATLTRAPERSGSDATTG